MDGVDRVDEMFPRLDGGGFPVSGARHMGRGQLVVPGVLGKGITGRGSKLSGYGW